MIQFLRKRKLEELFAVLIAVGVYGFLLFSQLSPTSTAPVGPGYGYTPGFGYTIYTCTGMDALFSQLSLEKFFIDSNISLNNHIDCTGISIEPLGKINDPNPNFYRGYRGRFDGKGFTISNLQINDTTGNNTGLIVELQSGGFVTDLRLEHAFISGANNVGAIAGTMTGGSISNVRVNVSSSSTIDNCNNVSGCILSTSVQFIML